MYRPSGDIDLRVVRASSPRAGATATLPAGTRKAFAAEGAVFGVLAIGTGVMAYRKGPRWLWLVAAACAAATVYDLRGYLGAKEGA